MRNYLILIVLILAVAFSCKEKQEDIDPVPRAVIDLSLDMFVGEVVQKSKVDEEGASAWKVKIRDDHGSVVVFYWRVNNEALLKLEGENAPFEYEIQTDNQLLNFSTARTIAKGSIQNPVLLGWQLAQEEDFMRGWVYTFHFDSNGNKTVFLDAKSGDVFLMD